MSERERALTAVRNLIIRGQLSSDMMTERDLAEKLRMDRHPVREALAVLTGDGLVEQFPQKGFSIRRIDAAEAQKCLRLQTVQETNAVTDLASEPSAHDMCDAARKELEAMAAQTDFLVFLERETDFHLALARAAGYDEEQFLRGLRNRLQMFFVRNGNLGEEYMVPVLAACQRLLAAIVLGNKDLAADDFNFLISLESGLVAKASGILTP